MKKLKDILSEVELMPFIGKSRKFGWNYEFEDWKQYKSEYDLVYKTSKYSLYLKHDGFVHKKYIAVDKKDIPIVAVDGFLTQGKFLEIHTLASNPAAKTKLPASDFYYDLLKHKVIAGLSSKEQSPGAVKVWQRLNNKKKVNVHGWDDTEDKPVNLGKRFDSTETHVTNADGLNAVLDMHKMTNKNDQAKIIDDILHMEKLQKMSLVAHLKEDAPTNSVGSGAIAGTGVGPQGEPGIKKRGKFGKYDTFLVSPNTFLKTRMEKQKGKHWRTYLEEDEAFAEVREYARKHKGPVILQCERTGAMCFARYS